jgi:hypothetical protein
VYENKKQDTKYVSVKPVSHWMGEQPTVGMLNVSNITQWTKLNVVLYNEIAVSINFFFNVLLTMQLDNLCNGNQLDALFILNVFRRSASTCFGRMLPETCRGRMMK